MYSPDINKICGLCRFAKKTEIDGDSMHCELKDKTVSLADEACKKFKYDIFKKTVHRRKKLKTNFDPEAFTV